MQVPPRDAVREAARRILSSSDYRYDDDGRETKILQGLWKKLVEWFESLGTLHETAPVLYWVLLITCSVLLVGIITQTDLMRALYKAVRP